MLGLLKSIKLLHAGSVLCPGVVLRLVKGKPAVKTCEVEVLRKGEQMYLILLLQQSGMMEVLHESCMQFMKVYYAVGLLCQCSN